MKKFKSLVLVPFLLVIGTSAYAQNTSMKIYKNGNIVNAIEVSQIDSVKFGDVLPMPTKVTATLESNTIKIMWNSVSGATHYEVYRSGNNSNYTMLAGNITATTYTDNSPLNGANCYKIKALDATSSSMLSAESQAVSFNGNSSNERIYTGVVAFNSDVSILPVSNDLEATKAFISSKTNDIDRTALCYAVSKSVTLFNAQGLPSFDKIFVVSFTDGIDNGSSSLYVRDGRQVVQGLVYDTAHYDLSTKIGLDAYTIGFGDQPLAASMQKLIIGKGQYKQSNSATLNATFQEIAQSVIASSKNVILRTQDGLYTEDYPKYVKFTFYSPAGSDVIIAKIVGYTLSIVTPGAYTTFDSPVTGTMSATDGKIEIPLTNLKFEKEGTEYQFAINVQMSYDNIIYYGDTEDTSTEEAISKKIAVVLVLDCSTSLGENFAPMQMAANSFINTLAIQGGITSFNPNPVTGVSLNKSALSLGVDGTETLTATVSPSDATDQSLMWSSNNTAVAVVDANGKVSAIKAGTAVITATTFDGGKTAQCTVTVVDGVVIANIMWARSNVGNSGTFAANPESYGNRYTWVQAQEACPAGWRVPTQTELQSLVNAGSTWAVMNGIEGCRFGSTPNTIFIPAAGFYNNSDGLFEVGSRGYCWSSTAYGTDSAQILYFSSSIASAGNYEYAQRTLSVSVRCVCDIK